MTVGDRVFLGLKRPDKRTTIDTTVTIVTNYVSTPDDNPTTTVTSTIKRTLPTPHAYRIVYAVLRVRHRGHGGRGRVGAGIDRGRRLDGHRTGVEHFEFGHRGRLLGRRRRFGPVEHALGAGGLEVEPAQGAGRAGD